jgi:hypothetical protein
MSPTVKSWIIIMSIMLAMTVGFKKAYTWFYTYTSDVATTEKTS